MNERFRSAFFAYPAQPVDLANTILTAVDIAKDLAPKISITAWPQEEQFGQYIPGEIREKILSCDVLLCDVTRANLNVYYEIGLAVGAGKPVAPVLNSSFADATKEIQRDGIFDSLRYKTYENSSDLARLIVELPTTSLLELYSKEIEYQQPLFVLDTFRKTDFRNAIVSATKDSKVFYRSFDPVETPRFSTVQVIAQVTSSSGIIIPLLSPHIDDAPRHNLRAAFLAGMGHGLDRLTLLLRHASNEGALPIDYRDAVISVRSEADIKEKVIEFAKNAHIASQSLGGRPKLRHRTPLQQLNLGASAAENEFRSLEEYFVETSEYNKTLRGEVNVVAGRKGSGKTAIFFQARDRFRLESENIVVDLKPESHQLSLFREELSRVVDTGIFDHTLTAFWYYIILTEVLLTLKRNAEYRIGKDENALNTASDIEDIVKSFEIRETGDFTFRINRLGTHILQEIRKLEGEKKKLSPERITNIIYRGGIADIKNTILQYTTVRSQIIFLFDNIDKGWPATGPHLFDVRLVRLLIEALDKVRRDFAAERREFMSVVFLRNDIYELMVDETPDRGKGSEVRIDWTDRAKLKQVILRRLQASRGQEEEKFEALWSKFFPARVHGKETFEYFVDHCLMRPRFLITIIEYAISKAIDRGHNVVDQQDCVDAVRQHSYYLADDFGYEIRDVSGLPKEIIQSLARVTKYQTKGEILARFEKLGLTSGKAESAFDLMLWYGLVGIVTSMNRERYIYDFEYRKARLDAEVRAMDEEPLYVINPAILVALAD